jgi:hypothetical protein
VEGWREESFLADSWQGDSISKQQHRLVKRKDQHANQIRITTGRKPHLEFKN